MATMENVKPDWRKEIPTYDNLTDPRTAEWAVAEEFTEIAEELRKMADLMTNANILFVGKLQNNHFKNWDEIGDFIEEYTQQLENTLDDIYNRLP